jgi:hypothetical protein
MDMDTSDSAPQSATLSLALSTQPPSAGREETTNPAAMDMDTSDSAPQSATLSLALSTQPPSAGREETTNPAAMDMDTSDSAPQSATLSLALSTQPPSAGREETTETTEVRSGPAPSGPQPAPQVAIPAGIWEKPCSKLDSLFGGDADASIYGELTAGSVSKIMRIILADMREDQESLAGNSTICNTIADPVSFLDLGSGTMRISIQVAFEIGWDSAGFDNSANRVLLGVANCKAAIKTVNDLLKTALFNGSDGGSKPEDPWKKIGKIATAMGDVMDVRNFNGFSVLLAFDEGFIPELMEHIAKCLKNSDTSVRYIVSTKTGNQRLDKMKDSKGNLLLPNWTLVASVIVSKRFSGGGNTAYVYKRNSEENERSFGTSTEHEGEGNDEGTTLSPSSSEVCPVKVLKEALNSIDRKKRETSSIHYNVAHKKADNYNASSRQSRAHRNDKSKQESQHPPPSSTKKHGSNILILGMLTSPEAVTSGIKNQAKRDMDRIAEMIKVSGERGTPLTVYTTSLQERGHPTYHHTGNFTDRKFPAEVLNKFVRKDESKRFQQILLDYFYTPSAWTEVRWPRCFFVSILPRLSAEDILTHGGVVYLPFSPYVFKCVMAYLGELLAEYSISFVRKDEFKKLAFVPVATNTDEQHEGKNAENEELLRCTTDLARIKLQADCYITKENLVESLNKVQNWEEVRLIRLTRQSEGEINYEK